jgi:hypothetical protein
MIYVDAVQDTGMINEEGASASKLIPCKDTWHDHTIDVDASQRYMV